MLSFEALSLSSSGFFCAYLDGKKKALCTCSRLTFKSIRIVLCLKLSLMDLQWAQSGHNLLQQKADSLNRAPNLCHEQFNDKFWVELYVTWVHL